MHIAPPSATERAAVRLALLTLAERQARPAEGPLGAALYLARAEEIVRDLTTELVVDARTVHELTWREVGDAFGMSMQSAHWRFTRPARPPVSRLRR